MQYGVGEHKARGLTERDCDLVARALRRTSFNHWPQDESELLELCCRMLELLPLSGDSDQAPK